MKSMVLFYPNVGKFQMTKVPSSKQPKTHSKSSSSAAVIRGGRYWCHMCSQTITPATATEFDENIKCPFCLTGFVEEMGDTNTNTDGDDDH
ncbi:hypothetical protein Scep_024431 [Stephania cephalantha]|uniref:RING-type E3 ubiquitin transferase n=1 Tax=Stephania cephalantha TaxID=152367 RepID=A0AAP0EWJ1_9MAGN